MNSIAKCTIWLYLITLFCPLFPCKASDWYTTLYDARVMYHALNPKATSNLEGIDPTQTIDVIDDILEKYCEQNGDLSEEKKKHIQTLRSNLSSSKMQYQTCIRLVKLPEESKEKAHTVASQLALETELLYSNLSHPSILFIGGHYYYANASLWGHTATYEVHRQKDGRLSFIVNNTGLDEHHNVYEDRIHQLVYHDLLPCNLDVTFWKNVIQTNYMHPKKENEKLMQAFYTYIDSTIFKNQNKSDGLLYNKQNSGVCAWMSIMVWLQNNIDTKDYEKIEKLMFETMQKEIKSDGSFETIVHYENQEIPASLFLKQELEKKLSPVNKRSR